VNQQLWVISAYSTTSFSKNRTQGSALLQLFTVWSIGDPIRCSVLKNLTGFFLTNSFLRINFSSSRQIVLANIDI
jgi:hypothetical protein